MQAEKTHDSEDNRALKERLVREGRARVALVVDGDAAVAWCQYGSNGANGRRGAKGAEPSACPCPTRLALAPVGEGARGGDYAPFPSTPVHRCAGHSCSSRAHSLSRIGSTSEKLVQTDWQIVVRLERLLTPRSEP
jgi:hypothetical protein